MIFKKIIQFAIYFLQFINNYWENGNLKILYLISADFIFAHYKKAFIKACCNQITTKIKRKNSAAQTSFYQQIRISLHRTLPSKVSLLENRVLSYGSRSSLFLSLYWSPKVPHSAVEIHPPRCNCVRWPFSHP